MNAPAASVVEIAPNVVRVADTCNVYVLRSGRDAVLVDFGSGAVLDLLPELGVDRVTDVLVTHHHRDQLQGLARPDADGIRVWVPPVEVDLIAGVDRRWEARQVDNDYDVRQDRFSLLEPVAIAGTVAEYRTVRYGDFEVYTLPTPGHTTGSVTYLIDVDGRRLAFSGDLVYGDGKVWSLSATQWSYTGVEGLASTVLSCAVLAKHEPDVLLPSHGEPVSEPAQALALTRARLAELVDMRLPEPWDLDAWLERPWQQLSPHLLRNRTSLATTYALLSDTGGALLIDFGYDLTAGTPPVSDRASRRPLLATFDALRRDFGVERIEVVVTTHYHDDHVAGINLLRDVEGTEVWSPENVAPIVQDPRRYDLPCLWFDAVRVDRVLALGEPIEWHEHVLTAHALPGHTLYAAAIAFEVDGKRVVATGDQQSFEAGGRSILNYQYRNRFRIDDYVRSAELYRELRPDLILTGHWGAREVDDALLDRLLADGTRVAELHRELLPLDEVDLDAEGFAARLEPYRSTVPRGGTGFLEVAVRNPFDRAAEIAVELVTPDGWSAGPANGAATADAHETVTLSFELRVGDVPARRARVAADVTVDGVPLGQQAEALVTVE